jgi:hypothetical protein
LHALLPFNFPFYYYVFSILFHKFFTTLELFFYGFSPKCFLVFFTFFQIFKSLNFNQLVVLPPIFQSSTSFSSSLSRPHMLYCYSNNTVYYRSKSGAACGSNQLLPQSRTPGVPRPSRRLSTSRLPTLQRCCYSRHPAASEES